MGATAFQRIIARIPLSSMKNVTPFTVSDVTNLSAFIHWDFSLRKMYKGITGPTLLIVSLISFYPLIIHYLINFILGLLLNFQVAGIVQFISRSLFIWWCFVSVVSFLGKLIKKKKQLRKKCICVSKSVCEQIGESKPVEQKSLNFKVCF